MEFRVKLLSPEARVPERKFNSAGFDCWPLVSGHIDPGHRVTISLGFEAEFPAGYVALLMDRSSVGNAGCIRLAGVVDSDYRKEWRLILHNLGNSQFCFGPDKAICQILFVPIPEVDVQVVETLSPSARGVGFGSSDSQIK